VGIDLDPTALHASVSTVTLYVPGKCLTATLHPDR